MAKTVLVVDDIAYVRKTLIEILTRAHYQVIGEASDGAEAVVLYEKLMPSLVTMDIVMSKMSGIEATKRIIKVNKNAQVVIISAMGQENLVMEAIGVGAKDFILKPFDSEEVLKTLDRVCSLEQTALKRGAAKAP
ncbi:MAG: response regulator [Bdellovibrionia bacterium]